VKVACFCPEHGVKRLNHRKKIQVSGNRFENLTSIQLTIELKKAPVAYLSIGSLEHHGLYLPVVFYAMWIHQACLAAAEITGGVVFTAYLLGNRAILAWTVPVGYLIEELPNFYSRPRSCSTSRTTGGQQQLFDFTFMCKSHSLNRPCPLCRACSVALKDILEALNAVRNKGK
jgi:hypothetical protein